VGLFYSVVLCKQWFKDKRRGSMQKQFGNSSWRPILGITNLGSAWQAVHVTSSEHIIVSISVW